MNNDHHDSFGDFLGGLFQLFLLGVVIYVLFLIIWGIFKLIWLLLRLIWKFLRWLWSQIKKHAVLRGRMNELKLTIQTFLLKHQKLNRVMRNIGTYATIFYTSRPTELFNRLKKSVSVKI